MQIALFTITAVLLYIFADWLLNTIETRRGKRLPNRSVIFFVIIFGLSMISFEVIQQVLQELSETQPVLQSEQATELPTEQREEIY